MRHYIIRLLKNWIFRDELGLLLRYESKRDDKSTLIDVGAATGEFTLPFAKKGWQVIAFEPEPINFRDLKNKLKKFPNVTCIAKAVSDTSGQVPFYVSSTHGGIHTLKPFHPTHRPTMTVDAVRLDETIADMRIDQVTMLKIDIEGADFLALKSFDFSKFRPDVVMCEFMDERSRENFGYTHHDMAAYMNNLGYTTFVSEWGQIVEYAREDRLIVPPKFLGCAPYPLDHDPVWGNLIFIPNDRKQHFERILPSYLTKLRLSNLVVRAAVSTLCFVNQRLRCLNHER
jgi:FkbM family methyltransferase